MKLWKISQTVNNDYETYDSAIVAAETEEEARLTHPDPNGYRWYPDHVFNDCRYPHESITGAWGKTWLSYVNYYECRDDSWSRPEHVTVELIGEAIEGTERGAILASYNAG